MLILYASVYLGSMHFILCFMGINAWVDSVMVASSSPIEGSRTLQVSKSLVMNVIIVTKFALGGRIRCGLVHGYQEDKIKLYI